MFWKMDRVYDYIFQAFWHYAKSWAVKEIFVNGLRLQSSGWNWVVSFSVNEYKIRNGIPILPLDARIDIFE